MNLLNIKPGVITGNQVQEIFKHAKKNAYALPAANVIGTNTVNGVMETAAKLNAPVILQFSNGGAQFYAGKGLNNENQEASIAGAISGAKHVHLLAELYGATVILHTDHCAKKLLPWIDGLLDASEVFYDQHGKSLFSSHMIDLSEEPLKENIEILGCKPDCSDAYIQLQKLIKENSDEISKYWLAYHRLNEILNFVYC